MKPELKVEQKVSVLSTLDDNNNDSWFVAPHGITDKNVPKGFIAHGIGCITAIKGKYYYEKSSCIVNCIQVQECLDCGFDQELWNECLSIINK